MPRPEIREITFSIDGREVRAPENVMLVDGAKYGDVEIPVFCYEPKLGQPVGACRMCLVEVEGIPKLQTACSTPVKDGMVVHTQTARVREAQQAVVEFLLINHPLDCPVCDKGGECPLQDISYGWGGGRSRFIEPKRHFVKPLELSPLVAIDRERCILCYRCVRFSQEIAEDYQLVLQERGAASYVATFDGHPYVAPFSGNIIELCPVGALTSRPYRFRARPWDVEGSGSICTMCPAQCNVTFTVRDDRVLRVLARGHDGVDDGWLCDKGRFAYQSIHVDERITEPMVRDGGVLRATTWERALAETAAELQRAKGRVGLVAGGETTNEEGYLASRVMREALASPHVDSRRDGGPVGSRVYTDPALQAEVSDLEFAHAILVLDTEPVDDIPILDLRIRKGVRRNRAQLVVATARPSSLDPNARHVVRFAPGHPDALLDDETVMAFLRDAGEDVVILSSGRAAPVAAQIAESLGLRGRAGAGLIVVPGIGTNGRGLREVGVVPDTAAHARDTPGIAAGLAAGELTAAWLLHVDPLRDLPGRTTWERGLEKATTVIAHAAFLSETLHDHATVVFPAESYAEKEGTVTHPDGRVQRLRRAIGHSGETRSEWQVIAELSSELGHDLGILTYSMASEQLFAATPQYAGLTLEELGGRGVRWPERAQAAASEAPAAPDAQRPAPAPEANGRLRLGTFRSIWAAPEVEASPALAFLHPRQRAELAPSDAERLGIGHGERVLVGSNGHSVEAIATLRHAMPPGSVFLEEGLSTGGSPNTFDEALVEVRPA